MLPTKPTQPMDMTKTEQNKNLKVSVTCQYISHNYVGIMHTVYADFVRRLPIRCTHVRTYADYPTPAKSEMC